MIEVQQITPEDELYNQLTEEELEFSEKNRDKNRIKHLCKAKANAKAKEALKGLTSKKNKLESIDTAFPEQVTRIAIRKKNALKKVERMAKKH